MNEMMSSGIELMVTGMGIVFLFLTMLVIAIRIMTAVITRYFPETPIEFTAPVGKSNDPLVIAAITAAVHQYRRKRK